MRREGITDLKDKEIPCKICGRSFVFSVGEQKFYRDRGLAEPKRCPGCRQRRLGTIAPDENRLRGDRSG